jgi:CelD/BcsL family acetyltransferase involved in cellulose biosynthesis
MSAVEPDRRPKRPLATTLGPVLDWEDLGARWQELEARADASFFQSWSWVGCLAAERYDDPLLLEARRDGRTVALALFNRRRGWLLDTLWLHETGHPELDAIFIEYNGVLTETVADLQSAAVAPGALRADCLSAARHASLPGERWGRRVVLSGVDAAAMEAGAALGAVSGLTSRVAPAVDLAMLRHARQGHLDGLSANTRGQLRRSLRAYEARGQLTLRGAADAAEAHRFLDALALLHQASWHRRGRPGAFARPFFARFHHALIERGWPRGEVELWQVAAGSAQIGYLYNFQHRGRVLAYQSGFAYDTGDRRAKPGLTCHHLAIEQALGAGRACYDFLAGDDRYKRSLANSARTLYWLTIGPRCDLARLAR